MEPLSNKIKFKKRKTRKSLNEMRKRLYGKLDTYSSNLISSVHKMNESRKYIEPKNNCIATNRLTLGLFHKAVRSETITRPALSEITKQTAPDVKMNKKIPNINEYNLLQHLGTSVDDNKNSYRNKNNASERSNFKMMHVVSNTSSSENLISYKCNFSNSPALFSPVKLQITVTPTFEASEVPETSSLPTSTFESSQSGDDHQLYEDFIRSMPKYLKEQTPALIKEDVMQPTKVFLHNLYLEGCRRETEENILHCIQNNFKETYQNINLSEFSPNKVIEKDPMNYSRLGYARQQSRTWKSVGSISSSDSNSPLALTNTSIASNSFIHNTPEISFSCYVS